METADLQLNLTKDARKMNIVHISDIHFGNADLVYMKSELKKAIADFIKVVGIENLALVISGDITYQGSINGFEEAKAFFNEVITENNIIRNRIFACPGNHDIVKDESPRFSHFNTFISSLRLDNVCDFRNKNFISCFLDDVFLLLTNSAYHLNHNFGLIDQDIFHDIERNKSEIDNCRYKIAVTHHHLLNHYEYDTSVIRNSYPFLYALDNAKFNLILHGHQHALQRMPIGNSHMIVSAARSFSFLEKGYPNGINHYSFENGNLKNNIYVFVKDEDPTKLKLKLV